MKETFFKFIGAVNATWLFQWRNLWLLIASIVGGVIASRMFVGATDPRHVTPELMINLLGIVPGLAGGLLIIALQKRHNFAFLSCVLWSIVATFGCAAAYTGYQLGFTSDLAAISVQGYVSFLFLLSCVIGFTSALFVWATNKVF